MFSSDLVEEVERLIEAGVSPKAHALKAIGYRQALRLLEGRCDLVTAVADTRQASRKLASRQLSWLRGIRDDSLHRVQPAGGTGVTSLIAMWNDHNNGSGLE